jgi:hypothetical protein
VAAQLNYYATDEDIAFRASADFQLLCPKDQNLAWGTDGAFGVIDRWTLTSLTVDFLANGLVPGQIVRLTQPVALFKPPGDCLVVAAVRTNQVTLRRKGQSMGMGQPPGPPEGSTQVEFAVTTLGPQIERASYELNRRFGIDDLIAGRRSCDLFDPREVREATVLTVLHRQYLELSRATEERFDSFALKSQRYKQELDDLLDRTVVHWASASGTPSSEPTTRLSTRLSR